MCVCVCVCVERVVQMYVQLVMVTTNIDQHLSQQTFSKLIQDHCYPLLMLFREDIV